MESVKDLGKKLTEKLIGEEGGEYTSSRLSSGTLTTATGCPFHHSRTSMTAGPTGPVVVSDVQLLEKLMHFNREKIPARNVHALGCGAYGSFTVTNDISKYTCADLFSQVGKKTNLFARFSGIFTEQGDADTTRDPRGFAMKFYTKEGNWDLLGINTPVFAVRDAKVGPDCVHAFKRDPRNGCWNSTQFWDYVANHPESLHQIAMLYTDRSGTPMSYRTMNAYGCHTFSLINSNKERFWVKFHILSMQGAKGFTKDEAKAIAGEEPNFLSKDLWNAIEQGKYPQWRLMMQVMPESEGYKYPWTFDPTKVWKHKDFPLIEIGTIEINRNPTDYFAEVEQVAFSPSNIVPGIGLSPDKLLQGRLLIYDDTQHHRIGPNFKQLYINRPHGVQETNHNYVGGNMHIEVKNKYPHYYPSVFGGRKPDESYSEPMMKCDGNAGFYDFAFEGSDQDFYGQVSEFWSALSQESKNNLCENIAASLEKVSNQKIVDMMMSHFRKCNPIWGEMLTTKLTERKAGNTKKSQNEMINQLYSSKLLDISAAGKA